MLRCVLGPQSEEKLISAFQQFLIWLGVSVCECV